VHSLPVFLRLQGRPVILLGNSEAAEAKRRLLDRAGAMIFGEDADAALAVVALDNPESAVARLKARGILVNAVDRPDLCDFTLPAIVDRDPVLVAIGTGGASAGLAKALRQRIEALLPTTIGALATGLHGARERIRQLWPEAGDRRRAIDAALAEKGPLDPLSGRSDVAGWLDAPERPVADRLVAFHLASPDPDELTLRQARLLGQADRIFHRADVPAAVMGRARTDAARIACDQPPGVLGPGLSIDISMGDA
jgi:uroporphyrin-III C-methyltransferase/precorrin-2 dehydrogenase/sirohydrochlorin ferrochelatase